MHTSDFRYQHSFLSAFLPPINSIVLNVFNSKRRAEVTLAEILMWDPMEPIPLVMLRLLRF